MKTCIIVNPSAGGVRDLEEVRDRLDRVDAEAVVVTEGPGGERLAAARARDRGFERIVAAGGDGTVHGVVNGLREGRAKVVVGVVPLGTANDFARSLGLPLGTDEAIDVLVEGSTRRIDVGELGPGPEGEGEVERRLFVNVATGGFGGELGEGLDPATKRAWGPLAYLRTAVEQLRDLKRYHVRLQTEDGEVVEEDVFNVVVANGSRAGGNIPVAPRARMDDGLFDVVLVPAVSLPELPVVASRIAAGEHGEGERVDYLRTAALELASDPGMPFRLDGESAGSDPVAFRLIAGGLEVAAPDKEG